MRPQFPEMTVLGAARMAMIGHGAVAHPRDLPSVSAEAHVVEPGEGVADPEELGRLWQEAVRRSRGWADLSSS